MAKLYKSNPNNVQHLGATKEKMDPKGSHNPETSITNEKTMRNKSIQKVRRREEQGEA